MQSVVPSGACCIQQVPLQLQTWGAIPPRARSLVRSATQVTRPSGYRRQLTLLRLAYVQDWTRILRDTYVLHRIQNQKSQQTFAPPVV